MAPQDGKPEVVMDDLKTKRALMVDNGMFSYIAEALAPHFKSMEYWSPWASAFPYDNAMQVGVGLPGVKRVNWWLPRVKDVDLIIFPDVYYGPDQVFLEQELGKRVWGARMSEELELLREQSKVTLDELGVPIGKFAVCEGIDELRDYLKKHPKVFVKFSFTRGDKESFYVHSYKLTEPELDDLEHRLGPRKNHRTFIVEDKIEPAAEIAYDGYTVDGQWPEATLWGVEVKGVCYGGVVADYKDLPEQITRNNAAVAPWLKERHARTWFAMETRVTKKEGVPFVVDPMQRFGNPPGALCTLMYRNLAEIIYHGAAGRMVQPVFDNKWGVQVQLYSSWSEEHWQPIYFPEEIEKFVKLQYHTVIDGTHYVVPTPDKNPAVGSVVATGKTLHDAIEKVKGYADKVEGPGIKVDKRLVDGLTEEFESLKQYGLHVE